MKIFESEKIVCILFCCSQNWTLNLTHFSLCLTGRNQLIKYSAFGKQHSSLALKFMFRFQLHLDDYESWIFFPSHFNVLLSLDTNHS